MCFAAAAWLRGQGGLELWAQWVCLFTLDASMALYVALHLLLVRLDIRGGVLQAVVAHGLDTVFPAEAIHRWWATPESIVHTHCCSRRSTQRCCCWARAPHSEQIPRRLLDPGVQNVENVDGPCARAMLLRCDMAIPATSDNDPVGGGAWQSSAGRRQRLDYVVAPQTWRHFLVKPVVDLDVRRAVDARIDHRVSRVVFKLPATHVGAVLQ